MSKLRITNGTLGRDFYFIPTIQYHFGDWYEDVCICFLKWYIGITKEFWIEDWSEEYD